MNLEGVVKYSIPFFVIFIISRSIEAISFFYFAVPVMCLFFIVQFLNSSKFKVQLINQNENPESDSQHPVSGIKSFSNIIHHPLSICLIPGLWFLLTSLWSSYPEVSATRALYFILISTGCISAGFLWIHYSGRNLFDFLSPANVIVVLICLFSLLTNIPSESWTGGHGKGFMGFFGHQNLLASIILFTLPSVFLKLLQLVKRDQVSVIRNIRVKKSSNYLLLTTPYLQLTAYSLLLTADLLLLILTYSRSVFLSLIFGVIVFLILNRSWKVFAFSFVTAAVLIIITYSIPALNQFADKIIKKDFPEVYSSRIWMWEPSYKAALEGGLFGLGYGISHPEIKSGEYSDRFENGRLIREKGNSSLALIEEAGMIGLIFFILPIIYLLKKLPDTRYQIPDDKNLSSLRDQGTGIEKQVTSILIASLTAFILHAQFEAWWVGVGSVQLPLFFIYFGLIVQSSELNSSSLVGSKLIC